MIDLYAEYMVLHNTEMVRKAAEGQQTAGTEPDQGVSALPREGDGPGLTRRTCDRSPTPRPITPRKRSRICRITASKTDCWMAVRLFKAMRPRIDFLRAPIRGAFMMEIERMRWHGIPIDMPTYTARTRSNARGPMLASRVMRDPELNRKARAPRSIIRTSSSAGPCSRVMRRDGIPIPVDPKTGKYSCATKLIKSMIETYPLLKEYYEDKRMIDAVKNLKLEIGADGRNRFWLNPFGTKTGRNNPSTNRCVLGLPHTMRSFIKPPPGMALAQVDYGAEEVGIAAALSGDPVLQADYLSGDPYRQFAAAALGILNADRAAASGLQGHGLGRIYGLGVASLARNLGISKAQAQRDHRPDERALSGAERLAAARARPRPRTSSRSSARSDGSWRRPGARARSARS